MKVRTHIYVSGNVQAVYFRLNTSNKAKEMNITGWIKNLCDGRVEAIFEGENDAVERIIQWCRKGPVHASVENVEIIPEKYIGEFGEFTINK